jgi:hypothetical protein
MTLLHKQLTWGGLVSVTWLVCLAGCSLREAPTPLPPVFQPPEEATPAPAFQAHEEAAPAGKPVPTQVVTASWYGPGFHGQATASGETFNQHALTAAHRTLPLGTEAKVTNLETGQSVTVTINDRGPYVSGRHLDLSQAAAKQIGLIKKGVAKVKIEAKRPPSRRPPRRREAGPAPEGLGRRSYWMPGSWDVRMVYTDDILFHGP